MIETMVSWALLRRRTHPRYLRSRLATDPSAARFSQLGVRASWLPCLPGLLPCCTTCPCPSASQHFYCKWFHVLWPAPLQPYSSQDPCWHGLALLALDWRPFTRSASRNASPGTTLPLSTPILLHLTAHQSKPWGPSTTGGAPEELERGERRGANALDPPAPLADRAPPWRRRERRGYRRQPVPPFPARGKRSVTFLEPRM